MHKYYVLVISVSTVGPPNDLIKMLAGRYDDCNWRRAALHRYYKNFNLKKERQWVLVSC